MDATGKEIELPKIENLPDDPKVLRGIVEQLLEIIAGLKSKLSLTEHQLALMVRRLYGRKSERWDPNQLLMDEMLITALEQRKPLEQTKESDASVVVKVPEHERRCTPHGRGIFPDTLPHEEVIVQVPESERMCPITGEERPVIGYEESKRLHLVPAKLVVKVIKREKRGSVPGAEENGVVTAPVPTVLVPKSVLTNETLVEIVSNKFMYHLPLYRTEQMFGQLGATVSRSTLCDNLLAGAEPLNPLCERIHDKIIANGVVNHDDSPVDVMLPGEDGKRHIHEGRMWAGTVPPVDGPWVEFKFATNRKGVNIEEYFEDLVSGKVCCDALKGYDRIESEVIWLCGCWMHTRRGFFEGRFVDTAECAEALDRIREIYKIEGSVGPEREHDAERLRVRQELILPILNKFEERLLLWREKALPKSPLGKAVGYALNNWKRLKRFLDDPRIPLDNGAIEREIRRLAIGRNNWLFLGSEAGGKAAATYLTLIATAKRAGLDVKKYLLDIFNRILDHSTARLDELLPGKWEPLTIR
jgi:transposase